MASMGITWEFVRYVSPQAPPQIYWIKTSANQKSSNLGHNKPTRRFWCILNFEITEWCMAHGGPWGGNSSLKISLEKWDYTKFKNICPYFYPCSLVIYHDQTVRPRLLLLWDGISGNDLVLLPDKLLLPTLVIVHRERAKTLL